MKMLTFYRHVFVSVVSEPLRYFRICNSDISLKNHRFALLTNLIKIFVKQKSCEPQKLERIYTFNTGFKHLTIQNVANIDLNYWKSSQMHHLLAVDINMIFQKYLIVSGFNLGFSLLPQSFLANLQSFMIVSSNFNNMKYLKFIPTVKNDDFRSRHVTYCGFCQCSFVSSSNSLFFFLLKIIV